MGYIRGNAVFPFSQCIITIMTVIDISAPLQVNERRYEYSNVTCTELPLKSANTAYTGMVYDLAMGAMASSYIDLPGHIKETDDGQDGATADIRQYYRVPSRVIHFDYPSGHGAIDAPELEAALGGRPDTAGLIINALGARHQQQHDFDVRSVYLTLEAVKWIADSGVRVVLSDVYESKALDGVFLEFFKRGVATICEGRNMDRISGDFVYLTALFLPWPGVTQLPCRLIAETP